MMNYLKNSFDDPIDMLQKITDDTIQDLKDRNCTQELENIKTMAQDVLMMLQITASGGHLVDVSRIQQILTKISNQG